MLSKLIADLQSNYSDNPALAEELCSGLELKSPEQKAQLATWTILINTLYNLDITKSKE